MMAWLIPFPNISPEIFSVTLGPVEFALRWYALAYIVGLVLAWRLVTRWVKRPALWANETAPMTPDQVESLLTWIILGVVLGGRLGFVLFYQPAYYLQNPDEILMIWQGGMAFHGGLLGVLIAVILFTRRAKVPFMALADSVCATVPPALLLGRLANFINAELWGRPTDVPWAVAFPGALAQNCPGVEGVCGRHPSQLYEAGLEGALLGLICLWVVGRGGLKRPGLLSGLFFLGYGLSRIFVELFRQADAQFITPDNPAGYVIGTATLGLTMGQVLSLPMVGLGLILLFWSFRRAQ